MTLTTNQRFDSYVELIPFSTCHYWIGTTTTKGYGKIKINKKSVATHRYAYERAKGPIPAGMFVLHSCHTKTCVNPDHLRIGTHAENMQDMTDAGRQAKGIQNRGGIRKLTEDDVMAIRTATGTQQTIADDYGISNQHVSSIMLGQRWADIS